MVVVVGSAVPMVVTAVCTAPAVINIILHLPLSARTSQASLQTFLSRLPKKTMVEFTGMRFLPWPKKRTYFLEDLRTVTPKGLWIANLERAAPMKDGKPERSWLHASLNQYHVRDNPKYTTNIPGVGAWKVLLETIKRNTEAQGQQSQILRRRPAPQIPEAKTRNQ